MRWSASSVSRTVRRDAASSCTRLRSRMLAGRTALPSCSRQIATRRDSEGPARDWAPDLTIVAAYGRILPRADAGPAARGAASTSMLRCCPSTAARRRFSGRSCAARPTTGVTIMRMNERMDEGDILLQRETAIGDGRDPRRAGGSPGRCSARRRCRKRSTACAPAISRRAAGARRRHARADDQKVARVASTGRCRAREIVRRCARSTRGHRRSPRGKASC